MSGNKELTAVILSLAEAQAKLVEYAHSKKLGYAHWYPYWLELRQIQDEIIELNRKVTE